MRRTEILDGALAVLADRGMRGLTHRAVDAAAGLPAGSTSYYFRSRAALVAGCVRRLLERDVEHDVPTVEAAVPGGVAGLVDALTGIGVRMVTVERRRTLARYELSLAGVRDPALRAELVRGGDVIRQRGAALLHRAGATDPGCGCGGGGGGAGRARLHRADARPGRPRTSGRMAATAAGPAGTEPAGPRDRGGLIVRRARARNSRAVTAELAY